MDMDVWKLANALSAVPKLPNECNKEEASKFLGRMCLLEVNDPPSPFRFDKRAHMFGRVCGFSVEEGGFFVQPFNGLGDPDGKPMVETSLNVNLLPSLQSSIVIDTAGTGQRVAAYSLQTASVKLTIGDTKRKSSVQNESESASAPKKKKRSAKAKVTKAKVTKTKTKNVKTRAKKKKSESASAAKKKKRSPKAKVTKTKTKSVKTKKEPLDKGSSTSTELEGASNSTIFTLAEVLKSFADPRG